MGGSDFTVSKLATLSPVASSFKKVKAYFGFGLVACQSCSGPVAVVVAVVLLHDCQVAILGVCHSVLLVVVGDRCAVLNEDKPL